MMLLPAQILPSVEVIEQKYLEPGHTEMEVDSMHAAIDSARKNVKVMVPSGWPVVLQMARRNKPYEVVEIDQKEINNLHDLAMAIGANKHEDDDGVPANWMKIKSTRLPG